ncbi:MAG: hypothetical protein ACETWM_11075 [Candidatus Lokiarchaeia archaeon]
MYSSARKIRALRWSKVFVKEYQKVGRKNQVFTSSSATLRGLWGLCRV